MIQHSKEARGERRTKRASRFMPKYTQRRSWPAWIALAILAFVPLGFLLAFPIPTGIVISLLVVMTIIGHRRHKARLKFLRESRPGESICEFSRSFDTKEIDTWVVRAVYEQLQGYLGGDPPVPIRATDRLNEDLPIDSEDLEIDVMNQIAQRTGRSLKNTPANPYFDKVRTVGDLVRFVNAQPKENTPST